MGLFSRKKEVKEDLGLASERIIMEQLEDDDEAAAHLVDELQIGKPLVLNFEKLDLMSANKMLAFFTGACYASSGRTIKINETTYLFARNIDFNDGSLNDFLNDLDED